MANIDRMTAESILRDMDIALKSIAAKYGLLHKRGRGRFDAAKLKASFEFNVQAAGNPTVTVGFGSQHAVTASASRDLSYLLPGAMGKQFTWKRHSFKVVGASLRRHKYPIDTIRDDGKPFHFTTELVRKLIVI